MKSRFFHKMTMVVWEHVGIPTIYVYIYIYIYIYILIVLYYNLYIPNICSMFFVLPISRLVREPALAQNQPAPDP